MKLDLLWTDLFSVIVKHPYFEEGRCTALWLRVSNCRAGGAAAWDCRTRAAQDGLTVAYGTRNARSPALGAASGQSFVVALTAHDDAFSHYTVLGPRFAYFAGTVQHGAQLTAQHGLPVRRKAFSCRFDSKQSGRALTLERLRDNAAIWQTDAPRGPFGMLALDFRTLPDGGYVLRLDGAELTRFMLTDMDLRDVIGFAELFAAPPQTGQAVPTITLAFEQVMPRWRFIVTARNPKVDLSQARLETTSGVAFDGPVATNHQDRPAIAFTSTVPLPLKQYPNRHYSFDLVLPKSAVIAKATRRVRAAGYADLRAEKTGLWATVVTHL